MSSQPQSRSAVRPFLVVMTVVLVCCALVQIAGLLIVGPAELNWWMWVSITANVLAAVMCLTALRHPRKDTPPSD